jgi:hypothetical protein
VSTSTIRTVSAVACLAIAWFIPACTESSRPPTSASSTNAAGSLTAQPGAATVHQHGYLDNGYIDGWFNGETVQLYYTKSFFCDPLSSSVEGAAPCEIGADAEVPPREGPIPIIYAIAWTGATQPVQPDPTTFACGLGSVCLDHPGMIDASRVGRGISIPALPHSHIVTEHHAGWHHTVNIRVGNLSAWNQIAAAKTLDKVREMQAAGLALPDVPTNIYFFIASWRH